MQAQLQIAPTWRPRSYEDLISCLTPQLSPREVRLRGRETRDEGRGCRPLSLPPSRLQSYVRASMLPAATHELECTDRSTVSALSPRVPMGQSPNYLNKRGATSPGPCSQRQHRAGDGVRVMDRWHWGAAPRTFLGIVSGHICLRSLKGLGNGSLWGISCSDTCGCVCESERSDMGHDGLPLIAVLCRKKGSGH